MNNTAFLVYFMVYTIFFFSIFYFSHTYSNATRSLFWKKISLDCVVPIKILQIMHYLFG